MSENTHGTSRFRRVVTTLTIGSFSVAALMGIVALLGGGDFGENEARVLLTTLTVSLAASSGVAAWYSGVQLLSVYAVFAVTLYLVPS